MPGPIQFEGRITHADYHPRFARPRACARKGAARIRQNAEKNRRKNSEKFPDSRNSFCAPRRAGAQRLAGPAHLSSRAERGILGMTPRALTGKSLPELHRLLRPDRLVDRLDHL